MAFTKNERTNLGSSLKLGLRRRGYNLLHHDTQLQARQVGTGAEVLADTEETQPYGPWIAQTPDWNGWPGPMAVTW